MDISIQEKSGVLYVCLSGELDEYSSGYVRNEFENAFKNFTFNDVVVDMKKLDFMDSTGIGVLIGRYKVLKKNNKGIYISNPNPTIEKIIKMSGIYEIMPKIS